MTAIERTLCWLGIVAGACLLSWTGVAVVGSTLSNGRADFCYVEIATQHGMHRLVGHRPWRVDMTYGVYPSLKEAKAAADTIGCSIGER